jgi:hypothetical protein
VLSGFSVGGLEGRKKLLYHFLTMSALIRDRGAVDESQ